MPEDGDIDYRRLTSAQLREARETIDAVRYPKNFANLVGELRARPPEPPLGSVLPDVLVLSTQTAARIGAIVSGMFAVIGVASAATLIWRPEAFYRHFVTSGLDMLPRSVAAWLFVSAFMLGGVQSWRSARKLLAISLIRGQLQIATRYGAETVPLDWVSGVRWVRRPTADDRGLVEICLKNASSFGTSLKFSPRSEASVAQFINIVNYRAVTGHFRDHDATCA